MSGHKVKLCYAHYATHGLHPDLTLVIPRDSPAVARWYVGLQHQLFSGSAPPGGHRGRPYALWEVLRSRLGAWDEATGRLRDCRAKVQLGDKPCSWLLTFIQQRQGHGCLLTPQLSHTGWLICSPPREGRRPHTPPHTPTFRPPVPAPGSVRLELQEEYLLRVTLSLWWGNGS